MNCAVYSKGIAAAELFGYRKGAFTGADGASLGHVRAAQGGTLLAQGAHRSGEVIGLRQQRGRPVDDHPALGGQRRAALAAVQQGHPQRPLEGGHPAAHARLREPQLAGRLADAAQAGDQHEQVEVLEVGAAGHTRSV